MDKEKLSTQSLVFGILSLLFTELSILGIIFGAVVKSKAKKFAELNEGVVTGKAKVGKILSTLGLVFSIICLVVTVILVIVMVTNPAFRQQMSQVYGF